MKRAICLGLGLLGLLGACASEDGARVGEKQDAIRFGTPWEPEGETTVLIEIFANDHSDADVGSGVLLSPEWVLTAGHVVDSAVVGGQVSNAQIFVTHGNADSSNVTGVRSVYFHPRHVPGRFAAPQFPTEVDVALLRVDPPMEGVPVRTLWTGDPNTLVGTNVQCFGYGYQDEDAAGNADGLVGLLTTAVLPVTSVGPTFMQLRENIFGQIQLPGDSGGPCTPAFLSDIYGVHSSQFTNPGTPPHFANVVHVGAFRDWANEVMSSCVDRSPGAADYCDPPCPCNMGDGDCEAGECASGLTCDDNVGAAFGMPAGHEVCVPNGCQTRVIGDGEYCQPGCPCGHGGGDCESADCLPGLVCDLDVGKGYNMPTTWDVCVPAGCETRVIGSTSYCSAGCRCGHGGGDCDSDAQCLPGLRCRADIGPDFGYPAGHDVCAP